MAAVLRGRSDGDGGARRVAKALKAADPDLPRRLMATPEFACFEKQASAPATLLLRLPPSPTLHPAGGT